MRNERAKLAKRDEIEARIRTLTAEFRDGNRSTTLMAEVEVLTAAAFVDPVAQVRGGEVPLSSALVRFTECSFAEFKSVFTVADYARDVDQAYEIARKVKGRGMAHAILEDILLETGDPVEVAMLVIERMVSPAIKFRAPQLAEAAAAHASV